MTQELDAPKSFSPFGFAPWLRGTKFPIEENPHFLVHLGHPCVMYHSQQGNLKITQTGDAPEPYKINRAVLDAFRSEVEA